MKRKLEEVHDARDICPGCGRNILADPASDMTHVDGRPTLLCACGKHMLLGAITPGGLEREWRERS